MAGCKCCLSPHLELIDTLLLKGMKTRDISKELIEEYDVSISHTSIWRHWKNHLLPSFQRVNDPLSELDKLGQSRLKRAIQRSLKIVRTHPRCSCANPTSFRRKGIVYVCNECSGWIPVGVVRAIKKRLRKERQSERLSKVVHIRRNPLL